MLGIGGSVDKETTALSFGHKRDIILPQVGSVFGGSRIMDWAAVGDGNDRRAAFLKDAAAAVKAGIDMHIASRIEIGSQFFASYRFTIASVQYEQRLIAAVIIAIVRVADGISVAAYRIYGVIYAVYSEISIAGIDILCNRTGVFLN